MFVALIIVTFQEQGEKEMDGCELDRNQVISLMNFFNIRGGAVERGGGAVAPPNKHLARHRAYGHRRCQSVHLLFSDDSRKYR